MPQAAEVLLLKQALEQRFPNALPISYRTAGAVATGVAVLDNMLPASGLPRGRLSLWKPGGGATAILYAACEYVAQQGERAAWIDAAGTIVADSWRPGPLLLKPDGNGKLSKRDAEGFYAVHKERPFFRDLVIFMISGPVVVQVLDSGDARRAGGAGPVYLVKR